ncbi:hypothetical protein [Chromobacterium violaceum]|uniref:Uncharacterized protein n=1 Tax=Chromobacterium violaceum TaxID=536 RepID=A0AAX2MB69_CHRVL|nr:hypothetical protein [Chromobacterium violaceum]SUX33384.1 Uncharacterised protein [Chromobacterium violaceum]
MKVLSLAALAFAAQQALASPPDLQAIVRYETVSLGADGVEKTVRYSERWVRQGGHAWRERLNAGAPHRHDDDGHQHLDFAAAPRHVWRDAKGKLQVEFIHAAKRERIAVAPREWRDAGFDGSWARASQLVDMAKMRGFAKKTGGADVAVYSKAGKTLRWERTLADAAASVAALGRRSPARNHRRRAAAVAGRLRPALEAQRRLA